MVIDAAEEPILKAYREFGVIAYPTYILIDPQGDIVHGLQVRGRMLESIREKLLQKKQNESLSSPILPDAALESNDSTGIGR